jgi:hypothetical protein
MAFSRETLRPGPLLAPALAVVLKTDPELARAHTTSYLRAPNYTKSLRRLG